MLLLWIFSSQWVNQLLEGLFNVDLTNFVVVKATMKAERVKLSQIKKMEKSAFENNYKSNRFFLWHVEYLNGKEGQQFLILFVFWIFSLWIGLHEFHDQNDAPVPVSLVNKEKYNVTGFSREHPVRSLHLIYPFLSVFIVSLWDRKGKDVKLW